MAFSANFHPNGKWSKVELMQWGPGSGSCIRIVLHDEKNNSFDITLHYGSEKNLYEFVSMLREGFEKLQINCPTCGKEV